MKQILDFIIENKEWLKPLCYLIVSVISTVVVIVCKKKRCINELDNIKQEVLSVLPEFISSVEYLIGAGNGADKKRMVLDAINDFVKKKFSVNLPSSLLSFFGDRIESILDTPQKKK